MRRHVKILGMIYIVFGVIGVCVPLLLFFVLRAFGTADTTAEAPILVVIAVVSLPGIVAGYGLLNYKPWARTLAIVLSALNLLSVPIGTAISVYGLWVLLNKETKLILLNPAARPASSAQT